ncbi:DNA polymerase-4 [Seinonella peptonophila]|uniref:DNA polymerase IV n=1 Tax=Seinonella peptonophila TaxID=112248 RepID=A0A1M4VQ95_9BACL|nr:DNA polymerase IV [Seinonella peptonophila]SHE71030.1 DNA polymerase-4 [Seinonella peptonophila]
MGSRIIFLVDMQSFYASIEKADHPEWKAIPLVVSGDPKRRSGVILAACPLAKAYGVRNAETLWQAQQKYSQLKVVRPRMQRYLEVSLQLTQIMERFTDLVEPYSIDEQFMDLTGSQQLFGSTIQMAQTIQQTIHEKLNLPARIGISDNKVVAKMACDHFAKKNETGIFHLPSDQVPEILWPQPIESLFGVGRRMANHFRRMGIRTIGELAQFPVDQLKKRWGIHGQVLWMSANGYDHSPVTRNSFQKPKSIGHQLTLPRDYYTEKEIQVVLLELCEEVCRRARRQHYHGKKVTVGCRSADFDHPHGFSRQIQMSTYSHHAPTLFPYAWKLFETFWDGKPIRSLSVSLSSLAPDDLVQLDLFTDHLQHQRLDQAMDIIHDRYGATALLRASSLLPASQVKERAKKIGGHYRS